MLIQRWAATPAIISLCLWTTSARIQSCALRWLVDMKWTLLLWYSATISGMRDLLLSAWLTWRVIKDKFPKSCFACLWSPEFGHKLIHWVREIPYIQSMLNTIDRLWQQWKSCWESIEAQAHDKVTRCKQRRVGRKGGEDGIEVGKGKRRP